MANVKKSKGTIGILTGGGDVPGLNPAIRAVTFRALREGYQVVGIRRGWGGLVDVVRSEDYDNSNNFQVLTEEIVNRAGRTGGTFLHTSRTNPSKISKSSVPEHLKERFQDEKNDLTEEMLKNLDWLGIDYLIPIGGMIRLATACGFTRKVSKSLPSRRRWITMSPAPTTVSALVPVSPARSSSPTACVPRLALTNAS